MILAHAFTVKNKSPISRGLILGKYPQNDDCINFVSNSFRCIGKHKLFHQRYIIKQGNVIHKCFHMMEMCHILIDQIQTFCFSKYLSAYTFYRKMLWLLQVYYNESI